LENGTGRGDLEELRVDGRITLSCILETVCESVDWIDLAQDTYEHNNDPSVSTKGGEYLDQLSDYQLLKKSVLHRISSNWVINRYNVLTLLLSLHTA
jgi:hypothetical protein